MNGFEYIYHTPNDILNNILLLSEISPLWIGIFSASFIFIAIIWLYIIPIVNILISNFVKQREKNQRKSFIKQIAIQKDIEDQIIEEIDVMH